MQCSLTSLVLYLNISLVVKGAVHNLSVFCLPVKGSGQYVANNASVRLFPARVGRSYSCRNESIFMGSDLYLDVSQDRMQAFKIPANNEFGPCK